jgi:hypothetical protein
VKRALLLLAVLLVPASNAARLGGGVVLTSSLTRGTVTLFRGNGHFLWTRTVAPAAPDAAFAVLP